MSGSESIAISLAAWCYENPQNKKNVKKNARFQECNLRRTQCSSPKYEQLLEHNFLPLLFSSPKTRLERTEWKCWWNESFRSGSRVTSLPLAWCTEQKTWGAQVQVESVLACLNLRRGENLLQDVVILNDGPSVTIGRSGSANRGVNPVLTLIISKHSGIDV